MGCFLGTAKEGNPAHSRASNWRKIAMALTDPDFGKQKAQSGEND
jgi:hypothetical protein